MQQGIDPDDWKPMHTAGPGVCEIRNHTAGARRVSYVATRPEAICVLHAFEKETQRTTAHDLRIGRDRFGALRQSGQKHDKEEERG